MKLELRIRFKEEGLGLVLSQYVCEVEWDDDCGLVGESDLWAGFLAAEVPSWFARDAAEWPAYLAIMVTCYKTPIRREALTRAMMPTEDRQPIVVTIRVSPELVRAIEV